MIALALASAIALTFAAGGALAQDDADRLFTMGVEHLQNGRYDSAEAAFIRSQAMRPRAATMCNLALTYDRWGGHVSQAIDAYEQCAESDTSGRYAEHARTRAAELRASSSTSTAAPPNPFPTPVVVTPQPTPMPVAPTPAPRRSHALLWVGVTAEVAAAGALVGGILSARGSRDDAEELERRGFGDGQPIPIGSPEEDLLDDAKRARNRSIILYTTSGIVAALGAALILVDTARPSPETRATVGAAPLPRGGLVTTRVTF